MRPAARTAAASAILVFASLPIAARADDPVSNVVAQTLPAGTTGPEGQSNRPGYNTSGDQTSKLTPQPTSPPPKVGLFTGLGRKLLDEGIDVHGIVGDHFLANASAGVDTGHTTNLTIIRPAVDLDLGRLIGLGGGNVHLGLTFFAGRGDIPQIITQTGGFLTGFQTTPATETNLLSLLTYEQRTADNKFSVEVGRTNLFNYFLLPNSLDPFSYYSGTVVVTGDLPSQPYPTWGGRTTYKVTKFWYLQGGAFADNYNAATQYGDRFGIGASPGTQIIGETGYRSDFSTASYPGNLEAGFMWNTRHGRSNLKGTGAPANRLLEVANYPGGGVIFFQALQTLWRGGTRPAGPPANIALYGSINVSVDKPQPIDMDAMAGFNFTGLIPGRAFDVLGLQARYQRLSQVEANGESRRQRIVAGRGSDQNRNGFSFEAVGNIQVTPAIAFRPIVEYFVHPDNYYPPAPRPGRPHDGFEAGFFAVCSIGRLLGTSVKPN